MGWLEIICVEGKEKGGTAGMGGELMHQALRCQTVLENNLCEGGGGIDCGKEQRMGTPDGKIRKVKHFEMFLNAFKGRSVYIQ